MKVVWLNSGGMDSVGILQLFQSQWPEAEIISMSLNVGDILKDYTSFVIAHAKQIEHVVVPYEDTRYEIRSLHIDSAPCWNLDIHFRGMQYALENGGTHTLSGSTNKSLAAGYSDKSETLESIMNRIQNYLQVPEDRHVNFIRPVKDILDRQERLSMYEAK